MLERLDQKMQKAVESSAFLQNAAMVMGWIAVAETNCAKWRQVNVTVGLREKGFETPIYRGPCDVVAIISVCLSFS